MTGHHIVTSATVDTALAVDFRSRGPQPADGVWPRMKTLHEQWRVSMDVAVDADGPGWQIDVDRGGALALTAIRRLPGRRASRPRCAGCRSNTAQRIAPTSGLHGGIALHGDRSRAARLIETA